GEHADRPAAGNEPCRTRCLARAGGEEYALRGKRSHALIGIADRNHAAGMERRDRRVCPDDDTCGLGLRDETACIGWACQEPVELIDAERRMTAMARHAARFRLALDDG